MKRTISLLLHTFPALVTEVKRGLAEYPPHPEGIFNKIKVTGLAVLLGSSSFVESREFRYGVSLFGQAEVGRA